ncbi:MAG: FixH family protein [Paracoccaceae bacterium]
MAPLTGRKVFAITASAFAVIIGVNLVLATQAIRTFPGLEVKNSYVASQSFNADRAAQEALGWRVEPRYDGETLTLGFATESGLPADVAALNVLVGRATEARDDQHPAMAPVAGGFAAPVTLEPGQWVIVIEATAGDGTRFRQRLPLQVRG